MPNQTRSLYLSRTILRTRVHRLNAHKRRKQSRKQNKINSNLCDVFHDEAYKLEPRFSVFSSLDAQIEREKEIEPAFEVANLTEN